MKRLLILCLLAITVTSCSHVRQKMFYHSQENIAKYRYEAQAEKDRATVELLKTLLTNRYNESGDSKALKYMLVMMWLNRTENEHTLENALNAVDPPAPDAGELAIRGATSILPVALGIAGAAYGGYLINKAGEFGTQAVVAGAPSTTTNTTNNFKYQSENTQTAEATMAGHSGGGGLGGGRDTSGSGNQGIAIGQSQAFDGGPTAFSSPDFMPPVVVP